MSIADDQAVAELIALARREDLGPADITASLIGDPNARTTFRLMAKQPGVFAGCEVAPAIVHAYDPSIEIAWTDATHDGFTIESAPLELALLHGPLGSLLSAERVLLNFLQHLSGVATLTRAFVDAVEGTNAQILDTRKTTPGWRTLEKYAVRCGGGTNHRQGLFDAVLIKDNHLSRVERQRLAGTIFDMLNRLGSSDAKPAMIEIEAGSVAEVEHLLKVMGIDVILLDNFSLDELREAVQLRKDCGLRDKIALEASGGIQLNNVRDVARTGVDRISVGALTHSVAALDLSMERV